MIAIELTEEELELMEAIDQDFSHISFA